MPLAVFSLVALWAPVAFPAEAPRPLYRVRERVTIGKWFDGSRHRAVEEAVWLSPWSAGRLGLDWEAARRRFDSTLAFGVRLAALERQDPFEFGGDTAPGDDPSRASFTLDALDLQGRATPLPVEIVVRWTQRGRDPLELLRVPWLGFLYGEPPDRLPLGVGRNLVTAYELRTPLSKEVETAFAYRLRITTPRRTREAVFSRGPG